MQLSYIQRGGNKGKTNEGIRRGGRGNLPMKDLLACFREAIRFGEKKIQPGKKYICTGAV